MIICFLSEWNWFHKMMASKYNNFSRVGIHVNASNTFRKSHSDFCILYILMVYFITNIVIIYLYFNVKIVYCTYFIRDFMVYTSKRRMCMCLPSSQCAVYIFDCSKIISWYFSRLFHKIKLTEIEQRHCVRNYKEK